MTTLAQLGEQLATERKRRKLFKTDLSRRSGVNRNTLHNMEAGTGNVELNTLIAVCNELGLDIVLVPNQVSAAVIAGGATTPTSLSQRVEQRLAVYGTPKPAQ